MGLLPLCPAVRYFSLGLCVGAWWCVRGHLVQCARRARSRGRWLRRGVVSIEDAEGVAPVEGREDGSLSAEGQPLESARNARV
ncbi:unnamed protein product [Ectocarpus fasciculatus]